MKLSEIKDRFVEIIVKIQSKSLEKYLEIGNLLKNENLTAQNFKVWKINSEYNTEQLKEYLMKNLDEILNTETKLDPGELLTFIENKNEKPLKDLEFADTDIGVLEYSHHSSLEIFEVKVNETREEKCNWCYEYKTLRIFCNCKETGFCSAYCQERGRTLYHSHYCKGSFNVEQDSLVMSSSSRRGLTGLQNLGNTCFMNTSLQCLSNCRELTNYFIEDFYQEHINIDNPIGTKGVVAKAYSNLLKNLWYGLSSVYSPWNFKTAVERFQSMFIGYQQHDTQEFLNYLLDGLHEDLNKVLKKPIVEKDDSIKEDSVKSREQWNGFLKRNQSILVDLLYGQFKSTLYCPDINCKNISTTFDPFVSISLPLNSSVEKYNIKCYFIFHDISITPIQLTLSFYSQTTVMSLRNKIAKLMNINPFSFILIRMDRNGELDYFVNSSMLLKLNTGRLLHKNQIPFFCFQIDPNIFYSKLNNTLIDLDINQKRDFSKLEEELCKKKEEKRYLIEEEYIEDRAGQTKESLCFYSKFNIVIEGRIKPAVLKINTDNNNGLTDDLIKVVLLMRKYDETGANERSRLFSPRIIYINKNWTTKALHLVLSDYFSPILRKRCPIDSFDVWDTFFPDLEETTRDLHIMSHDVHRSKEFPYLIRIKNIFTEIGGHCIFCKRNICGDCLLPCRDDVSIRDILKKIPKNHEMSIDNSYYYMNEKQRDTCQLRESDFVLDIAWLKDYEQHVKSLNDKSDFDLDSNEGKQQDSISLYSCFRNFAKIEKLEEDNEWYCPQCKRHQTAEKKIQIYNSPHILTLHLKRFKSNTKLSTRVEFPIIGLDISKYVINKENKFPMVYDLFAVANHYGSLNGGHYLAYAKNQNEWYTFNDSSVSQIDESRLITNSAYVLFYRRRDLENYFNVDSLYKKPFVNYENSDIEEINKKLCNDQVSDKTSQKNEFEIKEMLDDDMIIDMR